MLIKGRAAALGGLHTTEMRRHLSPSLLIGWSSFILTFYYLSIIQHVNTKKSIVFYVSNVSQHDA